MIDTLKSCPFCGGVAKFHAAIKFENKSLALKYARKVGVHCTKCQIATTILNNEEEAARVWNNRVTALPVKYGRWDRHGVVKILSSGEMLDGFCQCENCGDVFPHQFAEYAYCPGCGAKMNKEADTHRNT